MKTHIYAYALILGCLVLWQEASFAQPNFQRQFGNIGNNAFGTKVLRTGSGASTVYYVLGQTQGAASVTRISANGIHVWTRVLGTPSQWNDMVLTANGNLFLIGNTLPFGVSAQSIAGVIAPNGTFSWVRSYDVAGREAFVRIVRNPVPDNASFPYYILGTQYDPAGGNQTTWEDVVLLTMNDTGNFGWKKYFDLNGDEEFVRDLDVQSNGNLILSGNENSTNGILVQTDNKGAPIGGAVSTGVRVYYDLHPRSGPGFYAVGTNNNGVVLSKFDNGLIDIWHTQISGLSSVSQVWEDAPNGWIYVVGTGVFNGQTRAIVVRLIETGNDATQDWAKYLDKGESNYTGGALWRMSGTQMVFVDGRTPASGGYGLSDAFMSVSDLDFNTCLTISDGISTNKITPIFAGPVIPSPVNFDIPVGVAINNSLITNIQEAAVCSPCKADFTFAASAPPPCGTYQFTNTSTGNGLTYMWNFGDPGSGANNTSTAQNPNHLFSKCGTFNVCLKITGPDCTDSICKSVTFSDQVKPNMVCPPDLTIKCDQQSSPFFTGTATATDNCTPNLVPTFSDVVTGLMPCDATIQRTWSVTDACGNSSACTQLIFVRDDVPPVLNCPQSLSVNTLPGVCHYAVQNLQQLNITATDNCRPVTNYNCIVTLPNGSTQTWTPQTKFEKGDNKITCTVTDFCNNKSQTCMFVLTVKDAEDPDVICPFSISVLGNLTPPPVQCKAIVSNIGALVQDNCPMTTLTYSITGATAVPNGTGDASGTLFMQGLSVVTYKVTDMAGNTKTCSFNINVSCAPIGQVGGVIGVKYRECDGRAYTNQEKIAGWPIALYADDGVTLLAETVTDSSGTYRFSMPYGLYYVKELPAPGWEPNVPGSGQVRVEIKSPQPVQVNFGNCAQKCADCPPGSTKGPNLIKNGDFEAGNMDFTSDYWYFPPAPGMPFGFYSVMNAAQIPVANSQWACANKTPGGQNVLVVDGTNFSGNVAWRQTITGILPNRYYTFCAYLNNLVIKTKNYADPQVSLWVGSTQVGPTVTLTELLDVWMVAGGLWLSGSNTSEVLEIRVGNTSPIGTDFAVDDIEFNLCSATPCAVNFKVAGGGPVCGKASFVPAVTGVSPFTYCWDFDGNLSTCESTLSSPTWQFSAPGFYVVALKITDATGCMATVSHQIYVPPFPTSVIVTGQLAVCQGQNTQLTASGGPWTTCQWSTSASGNAITVTTAGTYCVSCTDANGCTASGCATVVVNPAPQANISGNMNICTGQSTTMTASGGVSYVWTPGNQTTAAITVTPLVTTTYTVIVTDANGCTASATKTVTVGLTPAVSISPFNPTVCVGDNLTLTASGTNGSLYNWSPSGTGPTISVNTATAGTFTYSVTANLNGCTASTNVAVTVKPIPVVTITGNMNICAGQSTVLTATGGGTYSWTPGAQTTASINVSPTTTTVYTVFVTQNGCSATATKSVMVSPSPQANAGPDQNLCQWQQATLTASGGGSYLWTPGNVATSSYNTPPMQNTTTYSVVVTGANGCTASDQVVVSIKVCDCETNPIVQNGKFETGNPCLTGDEDIQNANFWNSIWFDYPGLSSGDFHSTNPFSCSPASTSSGVLGNPGPASAGDFGGFWCFPHSNDLEYREGLLNTLNPSVNIAPNSGYYKVSFNMACLFNIAGSPRVSVYGVNGMSTINSPGQLQSRNPANTALFNPAAVQLGRINVPQNCNLIFDDYDFIFNSAILNGPIDRIFITRDDQVNGNWGGSTYIALDDVCITPVPGPKECSECGKLKWATIQQKWTNPIKINCDSSFFTIPCEIPNGDFFIHGDLTCLYDACGRDTVKWTLDRPGSGNDISGTVYDVYPHFDISLPAAWFSTTGNYTLIVSRRCGNKDCECKLNFSVEACPCDCDRSFFEQVSAGFNTSIVFTPGGSVCKRKFKPSNLCEKDEVKWTVAGLPAQTQTLTGNSAVIFDFTNQPTGYYNVCMIVKRTDGSGSVCRDTFCQRIYVKCSLDPLEPILTLCKSATIQNGDFNRGILEGVLDENGRLENWERAPNGGDGTVFVVDSFGAQNDGHIVMYGGKNNFAGIMQTVSLNKDKFIYIRFEVNNLLGEKMPKGTRIEIRLQSEPFISDSGMRKQFLCTESLLPVGGWRQITVSQPLEIDSSLKNLIICLQNDTSTVRSIVALDNIEICASATSDVPRIPNDYQYLRLYPNPNPGFFTLELPLPATTGMRLRISDPTGRLLQDRAAEPGLVQQTIEANELPNGLYFLQVLQDGRVLGVERFVKQE